MSSTDHEATQRLGAVRPGEGGPPPRRGKWKRRLLVGGGVVLAVFVVLAVIGAIIGPRQQPDPAPAAAAPTSEVAPQPVPEPVAPPVVEQPPAQPPAPAPVPRASAAEVLAAMSELYPTPNVRDNTEGCLQLPGCIGRLTTDAVTVYEWDTVEAAQAWEDVEIGDTSDRVGRWGLSYAGREQQAATNDEERAEWRQLVESEFGDR